MGESLFAIVRMAWRGLLHNPGVPGVGSVESSTVIFRGLKHSTPIRSRIVLEQLTKTCGRFRLMEDTQMKLKNQPARKFLKTLSGSQLADVVAPFHRFVGNVRPAYPDQFANRKYSAV